MENRFQVDQLFRKNGFEIVSRPNKGEATWYRRGIDKRPLRFSEVIKILDPNDVADARYLELLESEYWDGFNS